MSGTLLIVDDESDVRRMLRLVFEARGWDIVEAASGEDALDWCRRSPPPAAIILDQRMPPGLSGVEVVRALHEEGFLAPILLYSAHFTSEVQEEATGRGVELIPKGELKHLLEAVSRVAETKPSEA